MNLNAEVQEFTVANGKNVVSGDFVSYYTTASENILISTEFSTYDHVQIGNGMCINQSNGVLYLLKQTENGLEILDAYNNYSVLDFEVLSDGSVVACITESPKLIRLMISNDSFQYVCSASGTISSVLESTGSLYSIEYEGYLYVFLPSTQTVPETNQTATIALSVYLYDISQDDAMEYIKTVADKITTTEAWQYSTATSLRLYKPLIAGEYFCVPTKITWGSGSGASTKSYITKFKVSNQAVVYISEKATSFEGRQKMQSFHGKYLFYAYEEYLMLFNTANDSIATYSLSNFGFANGEYDIYYSKISNDKIAIFFAGIAAYASKGVVRENGIFEINKATGSIMLTTNIFKPVFSLHGTYNSASRNGIICVDELVNDIVYNDGMSCSHTISYEPDAGLLTEKTNKSYVQPYTGGLAIGVAKQSGTAGQSIEVYVAKPST